MGSSLKCSCSAKRCGTLGQLSRSSFDSVVMGWVSVALLLDRIEGGGHLGAASLLRFPTLCSSVA